MADDPRMDPEMAVFNAFMAREMAGYPPITLPNPPRKIGRAHV